MALVTGLAELPVVKVEMTIAAGRIDRHKMPLGVTTGAGDALMLPR